ncbi:MAG: hypothetical protein O3A55_06795 [Bacteroidetes bacterium]|nr:hypothetical protein [Bacteroidota bacterium]
MKQFKSNTKFVIGIDGGGTSTNAILSNFEGKIISKASTNATNFQIIGLKLTAEKIIQLIFKCLRNGKIKKPEIEKIVIGISGAGRKVDQLNLKNSVLREAQNKKLKINELVILPDALVTLESAFGGKSGIILIAGTGSIAFGKDNIRKIYRVGGWGRIIGDEGSGYFIGQLALNKISQVIDGRIKSNGIINLVAKKFRLTSQEKIIKKVYREQFNISKLAPQIILAAQKGEKISSHIIKTSINELVLMVETLVKKGDFRNFEVVKEKNKIPIICYGGLIDGSNYFRKKLEKAILKSNRRFKIIKRKFLPVEGALNLVLKK